MKMVLSYWCKFEGIFPQIFIRSEELLIKSALSELTAAKEKILIKLSYNNTFKVTFGDMELTEIESSTFLTPYNEYLKILF